MATEGDHLDPHSSDILGGFERAKERAKPKGGNGKLPDWLKQTQRAKTGPLSTLHNALLPLRLDPHWQGRLRFDEMLMVGTLDGRPLADPDVATALEWMQSHGMPRMGPDPVRMALDHAARGDPHHPLRERLDGLVWDGVTRSSDWLTRYLGAPADNYHATIGFHFLVAMIARVFRPGCKADYMLVLEGPQGALKSSAIAILAGQYFSDTMPDLAGDPVRLSMHLRGKWIIEVSELSSFSRVEASRLKAFLTTQVEQYTPKYGRAEVHEARQCVLIATTNKHAYLLDETGARRFWPVECGGIDLDALKADRDQLLAEAVAEFRAGKPWWPDPQFEEAVIKPVQQSRYDTDAWDEPILAYLDDHKKSYVTLLRVAEEALGFTKAQFTRSHQVRVAATMRQAGWRDRKATGGQRVWDAP